MYDITTIGSAIQDIYVFSNKFSVHADPRKTSGKSEYFEFGTKIELDDIFIGVGGGASNAAFTFKNQGFKTACIARIGDDGTGVDVRKRIKNYGIKDIFIVDKNNRTGRGVFFLGRSGEKTVLVYRGATNDFKASEIKENYIKNTKWLYLTSLGGNIATLERISKLAEKFSKKIMINPGKNEIVKYKKRLLKVLKNSEIILFNREEASLISGRAFSNIKGMLEEMKKNCPNSIILITEGEHGLYTIVDNVMKHVIIKPVKSVDMTGAGDAFGSGFLAGYIKSKGNIYSALDLGVKNSAAVVREIGAKNGLLQKTKISKKISSNIKNLIK
ncbi:MAG: carbohydrate kinase family protein [Candidatus Kerfeldbacteria bacterium]